MATHTTAQFVSRVIAIGLICTGLIHSPITRLVGLAVDLEFVVVPLFGRLAHTTPLASITLALAGAAIYFERVWDYYLAYLVIFIGLWPGHPETPYMPFSYAFAQFLLRYLGVDRDVTIVGLNLLLLCALAWTHLSLQKARTLDHSVSLPRNRRALIVCLVVSGIALLVPVMMFVYALIIDPPGPGGPGAPGGGIVAFLVVMRGWPFVLAGVVGVFISWRMLRKMPPSRSNGQS